MNNLLKRINLTKDLKNYIVIYTKHNNLKYLYNITLICKSNSIGNEDIDKGNINQIINIAKSY